MSHIQNVMGSPYFGCKKERPEKEEKLSGQETCQGQQNWPPPLSLAQGLGSTLVHVTIIYGRLRPHQQMPENWTFQVNCNTL